MQRAEKLSVPFCLHGSDSSSSSQDVFLLRIPHSFHFSLDPCLRLVQSTNQARYLVSTYLGESCSKDPTCPAAANAQPGSFWPDRSVHSKANSGSARCKIKSNFFVHPLNLTELKLAKLVGPWYGYCFC